MGSIINSNFLVKSLNDVLFSYHSEMKKPGSNLLKCAIYILCVHFIIDASRSILKKLANVK